MKDLSKEIPCNKHSAHMLDALNDIYAACQVLMVKYDTYEKQTDDSYYESQYTALTDSWSKVYQCYTNYTCRMAMIDNIEQAVDNFKRLKEMD